ncbi:nucleotidyltransferase domain-containing protein [Paenibacillus sp. y28]|uniref:nucleotidyltransferase domain-containing protein n=1 Tax=Paenibacillus sp. y28 TaxID=3129110 RepID=UPI003017DBA0
MYVHHVEALEKLVEWVDSDPAILAVITTGSIAQGTAKETSDIDVYMVVTEECYRKREQEHQLAYVMRDFSDAPGCYIDIKYIPLEFVELAAEQGSEPTRASFSGSRAIFSRIPKLNELLARIPAYPEQNRERNLKDFYAQVYLYGHYFAGEGEKKDNPYLLAHAASSLVLFGGRIILAHNRLLFPCHKGLLAAVEAAPEKPDQFAELATDLLTSPTHEKCKAFTELLLTFRDPQISIEQAVSVFIQNNEWNWMDGLPPLQDR